MGVNESRLITKWYTGIEKLPITKKRGNYKLKNQMGKYPTNINSNTEAKTVRPDNLFLPDECGDSMWNEVFAQGIKISSLKKTENCVIFNRLDKVKEMLSVKGK